MTLAEFINARLEDDEYLAGKFRFTGQDDWDPEMLGRLWWYGPGDAPKSRSADDPIIQYVARHDPARVLRQVAAMRAIVGDWQAANGYDLPEGVEDGRDPDERIRDEQIKFALEDAVCHLAAIWNDHPDYRQEWKP